MKYPDGNKIAFQREMGERIRDLRKARGVSKRALADLVGVSPSLIDNVEIGTTACPIYVAARITEVLDGVDFADLVPLTGS